jgi:hypothetical protein
LKKTLVLIGIILVFIAGYYYFNKPQPLSCKGAENLRLVKITDESFELRGEIIFHNPNTMRARLGKAEFHAFIDGNDIGEIHEEFKSAVKGNENFHLPFQIRFATPLDWSKGEAAKEMGVTIQGRASSDALFADYSFPIDINTTVKKSW